MFFSLRRNHKTNIMNSFHRTLRAMRSSGYKPTLTPNSRLLAFQSSFFGSSDAIKVNKILGEYKWTLKHDGFNFLIFQVS